MQLNIGRNNISRCMLFCILISLFCFHNVEGQENISQRSEITMIDLFENKDWNSTNVEIMGFYLGMSLHDATLHAQELGVSLINPDLRNFQQCSHGICELCYSNHVCPGVTFDFGKGDNVLSIEITRIPEDASPSVRKAAITQKFKGNTYELFNNYSNNLRHKLLGEENSRESVQRDPRFIKYKYDHRGVILMIVTDPFVSEKEFDLSLKFISTTPLTSD